MLETARRIKNAVVAGRRAARSLNGATPNRVVWSSGPVALRHYPAHGQAAATPLLLITPIINRFRVVDLEAGGSMVESLNERGIDCYVVDWGAPRRIDQGIDWDDYVLRFLRGAVDAIGSAQVDVMGYCLGGTLAAMFAARFPERVRRLVTITGPVDFVDAPDMDLFRLWTRPAHFPVDRLTRAFGNMPGSLVLSGFLWANPVHSATKLRKTWKRFGDAAFAKRFAALESWNQDSVDIPGAAYRRLISDLYQDNKLAQGTFTLGGEPVDLGRIRCPVYVVTATYDTTCPTPAATALLDLVSSADTEHLLMQGGHLSPASGPKAKARLHAPLADWLLRQDAPTP